MGRRKFRLGRLPKNYDRKGGGGKKTIGRPRKLASNISSAPSCVPGDKSPDGILQSEDSTSTIQSSKSLSLTGRLTNTFTSPDSSSSSSTVHGSKSQSVPERSRQSASFSSDSSTSFSILSDLQSHDDTSTSDSTNSNYTSDSSISSPVVHSDRSRSLVDRPSKTPLFLRDKKDDHWMKFLINGLHLPNDRWVIQEVNSNLGICKLSCNSSREIAILYSIIITPDHHWTLVVHGRQVDQTKCSVLANIPKQLSVQTLQSLLSLLDTCNICAGHPEENFIKMAESRKGKLLTRNGDRVVALVDTLPLVIEGKVFDKTIRSCACELVIKGKKCSACVSFRGTLRKSYHRWIKQKSLSPQHHVSTFTKTNFRFLSTPEKKKRYSNLRARFDAKAKEVERMKLRICVLVKKDGVKIGGLSPDFANIVHEMTGKIHEQHSGGSFRQLFWEEQVKALSKSDSRQIKWHPALIKWCLHLKFISSGAYHSLRSSGVITLPSERTLCSYTHWIKSGIGFQQAVDDQLLKEMNISEEMHRYVVLCWDEVKVKEGLVFDKHACELIGFTDLGDINNDLNRLEQQCQSSPVGTVASHVLLFMVRGLFTSVKFPYAHFATKSLTADTLFPIVWEVVEHLEASGLNVIAFTSDGASANRKFYNMHRKKTELVYRTENPYRKGHSIFFFSDVPHLIKTTRNCWSNSFFHKESRTLWVC